MAKRAILYLNLGGPETQADVRDFLYRLFEDPEVIRIPFTPLRKFVAWAISTSRHKKSQKLYAEIGGGSPIRRLTDDQAEKTQARLQADGHDVVVRTAFTCSKPLVEDVVKELAAQGCKKFLSLPGYPQYSLTTTKGALDRVRAAVKKYAPDATLNEIVSWPLENHFLQAHADLIQKEAVKFFDPNPRNIHLLFSAHSIPEKLVTKLGDPYKYQMEETVQGVLKKLSWAGPWTLAWQSKLGPMKWIGPSTHAVIDKLGAQGVKQLLVVPIAFVTDHIETLNEIDLMFRADAKHAGIREFRRTPGLNSHPLFIDALVSLAKGSTDFWF